MKKSQYIFAIMAAAYFIVAILNLVGWMAVSENILLGLSLSALLSALSDASSNIVRIRASQNEFNYIIQIASDFLTEKITNNILSPVIDSRNVKLNVESMGKGYRKAVHPSEFSKRKDIARMNMLSQICFVLSIAVFILAPFPLIMFQQSFSVLLTLFAFASMCINLYFEEIIADIIQQKNHFYSDTQFVIQMGYPDFMDSLNFRLCHYENYMSIANKQEDKPDAHT